MSPRRRSILKAGGAGIAAALAGCLSEPGDGGSGGQGELSGYAALFALWDWTESIAGDRIEFENVLSVGEAGHGWNPPGDLTLDVAGSDAFVYLDTPEFSWAQDVADQLAEEDTVTIDAMAAIDDDQLLSWDGNHDHEEGDDHDHEEDSGADEFHDPHVWVDPVLAGEMVDWLAGELGGIDEEHAEQYRENAEEYLDRLDDVDRQFRELREEARLDLAIFAGHDSFRYIERRYGFRLHSPQGVTPDAEPTPDDIAGTIELVEDNDIDVVLYDPLETPDDSPPPLAQRILDSTDAGEARPLTAGDGTTGEWHDRGWGWIEQMEQVNLPSLRAALDAG
jgi:zinc transport system substrate-binding protein